MAQIVAYSSQSRPQRVAETARPKDMTAVRKSTRRDGLSKEPKRMIVVVVPPVDDLDLVGPLQVFSAVNRLTGRSVYDVEIVTNAKDLALAGESGVLTFRAAAHLKEVRGAFDTALLVCGLQTRNARDAALFSWLRSAAGTARRLGAVCVGAFLLAEAGLLHGRRASTHWRFALELTRRYSDVRVDADSTWTRDGNIYTCAGISAGIDLALAWAEEDCGSAVAHEAARELVLYLRRPSGQRQLSVSLSSQASEMRAIQELEVWIGENIAKNLSVAGLAKRVSMSTRNFERVFTREVGVTPSQYVLRARVESARRLLERTEDGLKAIAARAGFNGVDVMRRAFVRIVGVTPSDYRRRVGAREMAAFPRL